MGERRGSLALVIAERIVAPLQRVAEAFRRLLAFAAEILGVFFGGQKKERKLKPWMLVLRTKTRAAEPDLAASEEDIRRLLERMKQLEDTTRLSNRAVGFTGNGADYFADPHEVEEIVAALIQQSPPFLQIARHAPSGDEGDSSQHETEFLERETDVVVREPYQLFVPQFGVEYLEHMRPPGFPVTRTAKTLSDLRAAPLLYQSLPEEYLFARLVDGSVPVLAYREDRKYLMFRPEDRIVEKQEHRRVHVPIEIETGGQGQNARLVYLLFDRSTSLVRNCQPRGANAIMELAIAIAMIRCDMGRPNARYYFRSFADRMDPLPRDPPLMAVTVAEKDHLVDRLFKTNFSGEATNVVEALEVAADDIEQILDSGAGGPGIKPRIGLLTDGQVTIYCNIGQRLKRLGIELDTILIGREATHNAELMRISSTITEVDPALFRQAWNRSHALARHEATAA